MELSMYILQDWMRNRFVSSKIDDDTRTLTRCALSDSDDVFAPNCLSVGEAGIHTEYDPENDTVICRAGEEYLVVRASSAFEIYQQVTDAFIFYNQWESELKSAVIEHSGFQKIIDIAYTAFQAEILAFDWQGVVLGKVPYDPEMPVGRQVDPWIFSRIQEGVVCKRIVQNLIPAGFVDTAWATATLGMNIFFSDGSFAIIYIALNEDSTELRKPALMQLALHMRSIVSYMKPASARKELEPLHGELSRLLDGCAPNLERIEEIKKFKNWPDGQFLLYAFEPHSTFDLKRKGLNWMLSDRLPHAISFYHKKTTLMLAPIGEKENIKTELAAILPYLDFSAGVSLPFTDWGELPSALTQAQTAIGLGGSEPGKLYHCENYMWQYIFQNIQNECKKLHFVSPDAVLLLHYDQENDTELLKTLNVYLKCQSSMTAAADALIIHISTMKYRMKRIESLISSDLKQHTDRMVLLFSSDILLAEK